MKKMLLALSLPSVPVAAFAYHDGGDGSLFFSVLLYLICGVLSVVLFFKIWGMTNDVRAMRKSFLLGQAVGTNEEDFQKLVRRCRLLGNDDKVAELLIDRFCYQAQRALKDHTEAEWLSESIEGEIAELEFKLSQVEQPLPPVFKSLKTLGDFHELGCLKSLNAEGAEQGRP